jgi:peroxidase
MPGSLLGPTLQCLIGEQFYRSRVGDKYFYNNANFPHSFTHGNDSSTSTSNIQTSNLQLYNILLDFTEQFAEIKKASLATIICELGEALYEIQENPFKVTSQKNLKVSCFDLPKINLEYWKEVQVS